MSPGRWWTVKVEALYELPITPLAEWLDATYRVVSAETEMDGLDWDAFLLELVDGPGTP